MIWHVNGCTLSIGLNRIYMGHRNTGRQENARETKMDSRERLLKTLNGEETDRVPISLYEFDGFYDD